MHHGQEELLHLEDFRVGLRDEGGLAHGLLRRGLDSELLQSGARDQLQRTLVFRQLLGLIDSRFQVIPEHLESLVLEPSSVLRNEQAHQQRR